MISNNAYWTSTFTLSAFLICSAAAEIARAADTSETAQYRSLLADAVSEYDARRFDEARALFRRANDLSPNARTLRGVGMASFELRDYVEAYRALQGSLNEKRKPLTVDQRRQVEGLLEKTKAFTAHFAIRTIPPDAVLRIDGDVPVIEPDGRVTLGLGRHTINVDAVGRVAELREIHVFGGENRDLDFHLRLIEQPMAVGVPTTPDPRPTNPGAGADTDSGLAASTWCFVGGAAMAAGAVAAGLFWHASEGEINTCKTGTGCKNLSKLESERNLGRGATIGLTAGAVGLGIVGAILWTRSGKAEAAPAVACTPSINMLYCSVLF